MIDLMHSVPSVSSAKSSQIDVDRIMWPNSFYSVFLFLKRALVDPKPTSRTKTAIRRNPWDQPKLNSRKVNAQTISIFKSNNIRQNVQNSVNFDQFRCIRFVVSPCFGIRWRRRKRKCLYFSLSMKRNCSAIKRRSYQINRILIMLVSFHAHFVLSRYWHVQLNPRVPFQLT